MWKFEFHQPVFKKVTSADLNSLRQRGYQISVKKRIFDDPFHKKGLFLMILGARDDPNIRISIFFLMKWGCKSHWGHRGCKTFFVKFLWLILPTFWLMIFCTFEAPSPVCQCHMTCTVGPCTLCQSCVPDPFTQSISKAPASTKVKHLIT